MVLENVVEFLFKVGDGLAVSSIGFRLRRRVSRVKSRHYAGTYRRHVGSIEIQES